MGEPAGGWKRRVSQREPYCRESIFGKGGEAI